MRVLVAPTAFAGRLTAAQAAAAVVAGWHDHAPDDDLVAVPLSDGGPGLVDTVAASVGGQLVGLTVAGPLGVDVPASVLLVDRGGVRTAVVEAAQVCGLHLVPDDRRDPGTTSSAGVGALLRAAVDAGARRVVLGVGGLACHDGGAGMLAAFGAGPAELLGRGGEALDDLPDGSLPHLAAVRDGLAGVELVVAADTDVALLGFHGASAAEAEARGADAEQAQRLERALGRFAEVAGREVPPPRQPPRPPGPLLVAPVLLPGRDLLTGGSGHDHHHDDRPPRSWAATPGAGAAGGLGFALLLLGARVRPAAAVVLDEVAFDAQLARCDLVVTGEALFGWRSLRAAVVSEVATRALGVGVPVVVVAGRVEVGRREMTAAGIEAAYAVTETGPFAPPPDPDAAAALGRRTTRVARTWSR